MNNFCTILLALAFPLFLLGQDEGDLGESTNSGRAFLNIIPEMEFGIPISRFQRKMNKQLMVGKGIAVYYRMKKRPINVGLRIGDFSYDNIKRKFEDADEINLVQKTKNKIWIWYGAARFEPEVGLPIQPYIEASFGLTRFHTKTYTKETGFLAFLLSDEDESNRFDEASLHSDWGTTYGSAIGCYIYLGKKRHAAIDLQVGYRGGSADKFNIRNDLKEIQEEPLDNFDEQQSKITMFSFKVGFSILAFSE